MNISIARYIRLLSEGHDTIHVAVFSKELFARLTKAAFADMPHVDLHELPDGRAALAIFKSIEVKKLCFTSFHTKPESWLILSKVEDRHDRTSRVANVSGDYVRVETGRLSEHVQFVAAQATEWEDAYQAITDATELPEDDYDTKYEKLATPARIYQSEQDVAETVH